MRKNEKLLIRKLEKRCCNHHRTWRCRQRWKRRILINRLLMMVGSLVGRSVAIPFSLSSRVESEEFFFRMSHPCVAAVAVMAFFVPEQFLDTFQKACLHSSIKAHRTGLLWSSFVTAEGWVNGWTASWKEKFPTVEDSVIASYAGTKWRYNFFN